MTKFKKFLCVLIALVVVSSAAYTVYNNIKIKKAKELAYSTEQTDEFHQKFNFEENLNTSHNDALWMDAIFNDFGHFGTEYLGFTNYAKKTTGKRFEVVWASNEFSGVTDIYFIPNTDGTSENKIYRYDFDDTLELVWSENLNQLDNAQPDFDIKESLDFKSDGKITGVFFYTFGYNTAERLGCIKEKISGIDIKYDSLEVFRCIKGDNINYCLIPSFDGELIQNIYVYCSDETAELIWAQM